MVKISLLVPIALMLSVALNSGLLFSFTNAVSPGLKPLTDLEYLKAMKSINKEILNPIFLFCFFSPILLFPTAIYVQQNVSPNRWILLAGFLAYILILIITSLINVPMNNQLEKIDLFNVEQTELKEFRSFFENRWTFWNNIRTVSSVTSLICILLFQIEYSRWNS